MDLQSATAVLAENGLVAAAGPATEAEIVAVEASFDARLPDEYRAYLATVGSGRVGDLHVFSLAEIREGNYRMRLVREDVLGFAGNDEGDVYGFPVLDHVASPSVVFWDHEENQLLPVAKPAFLDFVAHMAFDEDEGPDE